MPAIKSSRTAVWLFVLTFAPLSLAIVGLPGASRAAPEQSPDIDPGAQALLDKSIAYLRSLKTFRVRAEVTQDEIVGDGFKLQRSSNVHVTARRPDRLRVEQSGDLGDRLYTYDGQNLTILLKDQLYYSRMPAPPTVRETLDIALEKHGVELPLLDVVYVAMGGSLHETVRSAGQIGASTIAGAKCTQLAFRSANVDWQIWVQDGAKPVPRKIVITTTDSPLLPQFSAVMHWGVGGAADDALFKFVPPAGAMPIKLGEFEPPTPKARVPQ